MSTQVTKDAIAETEGGTQTENVTPKGKGRTLTNLVSSVKRKIGQTLSPENKQKDSEVSGQTSNVTSPEHKKHITGKNQSDETAPKVPPYQPLAQSSPPLSVGPTQPDTQSFDNSSQFDTDDDLPLSGFVASPNRLDDRTKRLHSRNVNKGRVGRLRHLFHRRLTPHKAKQIKIADLTPMAHAVNTNPALLSNRNEVDYTQVLEKIQKDISEIKLDGSRLGASIQVVQKDITNISAQMINKECFDKTLSALIRNVNEQLDRQKGEIDHNRVLIHETEESVGELQAKLETCLVVTDEQESRLKSLEETVIKDLSSYRKELEGFDHRLSKKIPPVPFLPNKYPPVLPQSDVCPIGKNDNRHLENKNVIIEGLVEFPVENVELRVIDMLSLIGINLHDSDYNKMERLGAWNAARNWPRPIKLELLAAHKKAKILAAKDQLAQTDDYYRISIKPDEPKETRVARAKLRQSARQARSEGKWVKQAPDHVEINGVKYTLETVSQIGKALGDTCQKNNSVQAPEYPTTNKYAEDFCMLDTPRGMAFFTIRCKLSNFYPSSFTFNGRPFETAEHAYQAEKAITVKDFARLGRILAAPTAKKAKDIGAEVISTPLWERIRVDRMRDILNAKFRQNPHLVDYLCSFKGKPLIEGSWDKFWGSGAPLNSEQLKNGTWTGQNQLGNLLTELKEDLIREKAAKNTKSLHLQMEVEVPPTAKAAPVIPNKVVGHAATRPPHSPPTGNPIVTTRNPFACLTPHEAFVPPASMNTRL